MNAPLRLLAVCALATVLLTTSVRGQDLLKYRTFTFGSSLAAVSGLARLAPSSATVLHQRPAVLQDLEWRLSGWNSETAGPSTDPVERILFSFYDDQLYRVVVDYSADRTEGMTNADMIGAISSDFGATVKSAPVGARVASRVEVESGATIARWGDARYSTVLYRTSSYRETFRLIVIASALDDLARKATVQAVRLDEREAPQRELAKQQQERDDSQAASEKARIENKGVFRP